ncbi:MAG: hypothetical protein H6935_01140 [Thiobacillus sp.]|nr:hypothetical protein [Thiobacillus sp.]
MHRAAPPIHADAGVKSASLKSVGQSPRPRMRCLLALDAGSLSPRVISAAEAKCLNGADRIDILLVNSLKTPEAVLHKLLISLEGVDVDYRLTTADGELGDLVAQYLRRHKGITQIMVTTLPTMGKDWEVKVADLRYQGYRFCALMGLKDK